MSSQKQSTSNSNSNSRDPLYSGFEIYKSLLPERNFEGYQPLSPTQRIYLSFQRLHSTENYASPISKPRPQNLTYLVETMNPGDQNQDKHQKVNDHLSTPTSSLTLHELPEPNNTDDNGRSTGPSQEASATGKLSSLPENSKFEGTGYVKREDGYRFRCQVEGCNKLFKAESFWRQHFERYHPQEAAVLLSQPQSREANLYGLFIPKMWKWIAKENDYPESEEDKIFALESSLEEYFPAASEKFKATK